MTAGSEQPAAAPDDGAAASGRPPAAPDGPGLTVLERRYLRLIRLCYPAGYRRERAAEIAGTYLELAGPELAGPARHRPSAADVADLVRGGLRQHLRGAAATTDLAAGIGLAAVLALTTATALAAGWTVLEVRAEPMPGVPLVGPFVSLGFGVWVAWLLAAVVHLVAPGRPARVAVGIAVLLTAAVLPVSGLTGQSRPALAALLPQVALGVVALGVPRRPAVWVRLLPLAAGVSAVAAQLPRAGLYPSYYGWPVGTALPFAGLVLLVVAVLLAAVLAGRGDHRGGWALLTLAGPIGLLALRPVTGAVEHWVGDDPNPTWESLAVTAVAVAVAGVALLPLALAVRARVGGGRVPRDRCRHCGAAVP
jgi:hypothetical protein